MVGDERNVPNTVKTVSQTRIYMEEEFIEQAPIFVAGSVMSTNKTNARKKISPY